MLKVKSFRQTVGNCGPASLKIVLNFFNYQITEKELVALSGSTKEAGVDAEGLLKTAESLGFNGFIRDFANFIDLEEYVNKKQIPVIVDWFLKDDGHYSVVVDIDSENIYLTDPSLGYTRALRRTDFERVWFDFKGDCLVSKEDLFIRRMIVIYK